MSAVLQFEIDRKRLAGFSNPRIGDSAHMMISDLLKRALLDTLNNGGTFVAVVTEEKITVIQREEAEHP